MRTLKEFKKESKPKAKIEPKLVERIGQFEEHLDAFATHFYKLVPDSEHRTDAGRKLLEIKDSCIRAIIHHSRES